MDRPTEFDHAGDRTALAEYQLAVQAAEHRVQRLTIALIKAAEGWRFEPVVAALRALRGVDEGATFRTTTSIPSHSSGRPAPGTIPTKVKRAKAALAGVAG